MFRSLLILVCLIEGATAQTGTNAALPQARKAFEDCVYGSVTAQLGQMPAENRQFADISQLAEQGFAACATEERIVGNLIVASSLNTGTMEIALLGLRARIKRDLQAIAANPAAYDRPAPKLQFRQ